MNDQILPPQPRKLILVVEDSEDFQFLLTQLLEDEGYRVECAQNGLVAITRLREMSELPNLVLLDLMMPIMDGYGFKTQIDKDERLATLPIVLMTAHGDIQTSKEKIGAKDALRKPIDINQVLEVVRQQLR